MDVKSLYLEFMKKVLTFSLWDEAGVDPRQKELGRIWPKYAHTMIGMKRLDNIQFCLEDVIRNKVPGDLIETGVWRGGACLFMKAILVAHEVTDRRLFVADSFKGLPPPDAETYPQDKGDKHHAIAFLAVPKAEVENSFRKYGLLDDSIVFLEGWFKDTLPAAPIDQLALLRLDGDMYQSTMEGLTVLYPKLSKGGYCIIDDWALEGAKAAVLDYRSRHQITERILDIDGIGSYWKKEQ